MEEEWQRVGRGTDVFGRLRAWQTSTKKQRFSSAKFFRGGCFLRETTLSVCFSSSELRSGTFLGLSVSIKLRWTPVEPNHFVIQLAANPEPPPSLMQNASVAPRCPSDETKNQESFRGCGASFLHIHVTEVTHSCRAVHRSFWHVLFGVCWSLVRALHQVRTS